jgi:sugar lactone lactonase YvrE
MTDIEETSATDFLTGLRFGECPRWHAGRLWYSDFFARTVSSVDVNDPASLRVEVEVPTEPAGLGWLPDGTLLVVSRQDRTVLKLVEGTLVHHGDLRPTATFHANDMVVDETGRAYVGNFGFDLDGLVENEGVMALFEPPGPPRTGLVRIDPDGTATVAADELAFPNGTVITPDGATLIVAESVAGHLTAFDRSADGTLSNRRVWAAVPGLAPDGMCLDADGCVWVANAVAAECLRVAEGGQVVDKVRTSQNAYACMLGGDDRRTLFVVTAPTSTESVARERTDGKIEQARVSVPGAGRP